MRNNALPPLGKHAAEELEREGFERLEGVKNGFHGLRTSQTRLLPKVVIVTANRLGDNTQDHVVGVTVNGRQHYPPRVGAFSETWRRLLNETLLVDDIADWRNHRADRPERRR